MAWIEQCRLVFKSNADHMYQTQQGRKSVNKVLLSLAKESDIPFKTLERWWYELEKEKEKKFLENEEDSQPVENTTEPDTPDPPGAPTISFCIRCGKNPVLIRDTGKPYGSGSKFYQLCNSCRRKQQKIEAADRTAEDDIDLPAACPKCGHAYHISLDRIQRWLKRKGSKK